MLGQQIFDCTFFTLQTVMLLSFAGLFSMQCVHVVSYFGHLCEGLVTQGTEVEPPSCVVQQTLLQLRSRGGIFGHDGKGCLFISCTIFSCSLSFFRAWTLFQQIMQGKCHILVDLQNGAAVSSVSGFSCCKLFFRGLQRASSCQRRWQTIYHIQSICIDCLLTEFFSGQRDM